jgi:predicted amidohydrolase
MSRIYRIAILQDKPGSGIREDYSKLLADNPPDILALPEYYFVNPDEKNVIDSSVRHNNIKEEIKEISDKYGCLLIAGTVVVEEGGKLYNRSYLCDDGIFIGHFDKIHPYDNEGRGLIYPGHDYKVFEYEGLRIGVLICADVLYPDSFKNIRGLQPDLIFIPTTSPYRENEPLTEKFERDRKIYAEGALAANSILFKIGASGKITRHKLQGRSLIAFPGEIIWRIEPENEDKSALVISECSFDPDNPSFKIQVFHL